MSHALIDFLNSEGDESDYHSDGLWEVRESKLNRASNRSTKRRKLDLSEDDDPSDAIKVEEKKITPLPADQVSPKIKTAVTPSSLSAERNVEASVNPKLKPLTTEQLVASQRKAHKTGVVYLSRIPPFMRPSTVRQLLTPYGAISRLFLTPEPPATYTRRLKAGGNKKRSFIDGWVEFESKKHAKICAETLNGENIGGKKGGWYHDDIWNVKYLRGFKWADLMEQVQAEERIREGRMRAEVQRETRERKAFLVNVEIAKREQGMKIKRKLKEESRKDASQATMELPTTKVANVGELDPGRVRFERRFRQNEVISKDQDDKSDKTHSDKAMGVLSKIF